MEGLLFVCKGGHREVAANPRLRPGEQKYCPLRRCQRLRKTRWEDGRLQDEDYRARQRKSKSSWRQAHSKEDAAYRRRRRNPERAAIDGRVQAGAGVMPSSGLEGTPPVDVSIHTGRYLVQSLDVMDRAPQIVHLTVLLVPVPELTEQKAVASEMDAFPPRESAVEAACLGGS